MSRTLKSIYAIASSLLALTSSLCVAQQSKTELPKQLTITRETFIDVGPPNDFYEVIQLNEESNRTYVQRALVTPGERCLQQTTVEAKAITINKPLRNILLEKNPCDLSEKAINKERKRCKHCVTFSGQNITLGLTCDGKDRRIRADILDRDLFDKSSNTPEHTSWTMNVLSQLDDALGPGALDKPIFPTFQSGQPPSSAQASNLTILDGLKNGSYDSYFNSDKKLSQLYRESLDVMLPPSVELLSATPEMPTSKKLPTYPPIAKAARVEGVVEISFNISPQGTPQNITLDKGPEMLRATMTDTISQWSFPPSPEVRREQLTIAFRLNCKKPAS
jgi:TonB family protein